MGVVGVQDTEQGRDAVREEDAARAQVEGGGMGTVAEQGAIEPEELRALIELRSLPGIADATLGRLLASYGTAREALRASSAELGARAAEARGSQPILRRVERALRAIEELGVEVLVTSSQRYPARLLELSDPPVVLFARGRLELLDGPALAIVGARQPTNYGRDATRALAYGVARAGVKVISGIARGIDGVAHKAALDAEGGTIGVLGCGIDVLYPREHAQLLERIAADGLLLSEFVPGQPPLPHNFPRRNRIIAGLAQGVLVVEASNRSGSLITVNHALDLGIEVMAVPGPIGREVNIGTNELIRDGATMVLGVPDILDALGIREPATDRAPLAIAGEAAREQSRGVESAPPSGLEGEALRLWRALGAEPRHATSLASTCGLDPSVTLARLLEMELDGHVRQLVGMRFVRVEAEWGARRPGR